MGQHSHVKYYERHYKKHNFEEISNSMSDRYKKRMYEEDPLHGEHRKLKPPTFNGEKMGEIVEVWLL